MQPGYGELAFASAALGVVAHLLYFIRGEREFESRAYLITWICFQPTLYVGLTRVGQLDMVSAAGLVSTVSASWLAGLFTSMTVYRIFFHRLRHFPGPLAWRVTKFAQFFVNVKDLHGYKHLDELHRKYGPIVRTGPNELSIIDPSAPQLVLGPHSKCVKAPWYDMGKPIVSMHQMRSKTVHDRRRRVWDRGFGAKALRDYEGRVVGYAHNLMTQIKSHGGQALNASKWLNYYSFDVMGDLAFGKSFDMLTRGETHFAIDLLQKGMVALGFAGTVPWFFYILAGIPGLSADYWKFNKFCDDKVTERQNMKVPARDIMSWLLDAPMSDDPKEDRMWLLGDARLIIVAGSDTTAAALTYALCELIKHPDVLEKLREEVEPIIRAAEGNSEGLNIELQKATYLQAVIDEALRLHPPVPSGVLRVSPPQGFEIGNVFIPGDVVLVTPTYSIQRSSEAYERPDDFVPERWTTKPELIKVKGAYAPFSLGPFGCVGKQLALMELRTVLSLLLTQFDVDFAAGEDGSALLEGSHDHFTIALGDMHIVCKPRHGKT